MVRQRARCGFSLDREYGHSYTCYRPTWGETDACFWHADVKKSGADLQRRLSDVADPIDGATLAGLETGQSLSFDGLSLAYADFSGTTLTDANFADASLDESTFDGATLPDADFTGAYLAGSSFRDADVRRATFRNAIVRGATFTDATLRDADLTDAYLRVASFDGAKARAATFDGCYLHDAVFDRAEAPRASFVEAEMVGASLASTNLGRADFSRSTLPEATLENAILNHAVFESADLTEATLAEAKLLWCSFEGADLRWSVLRRATLRGATFTHAELKHAEFEFADLTEANFDAALAERVSFRGAMLFGARFGGTALYGASFVDAHVDEMTSFDTTSVYEADVAHEFDLPERETSQRMLAASVYRELEVLARDNALSEMVSTYFVKRQDIYRWNHRRDGRYGRWLRAAASNLVARYGESPIRVLLSAATIVVLCAFLYPVFGVERTGVAGPSLVAYGSALDLPATLAESLYFSTLVFTTLGFGNFEPLGWGRFLTVVETSSGVVLLAILVFVFGRRASR